MKLSPNLIGNSKYETDFSHKILLTDTQVSKIRKAFANGVSAKIKCLKTQLYKMMQSRRVFGIFNPINTINPIKVL